MGLFYKKSAIVTWGLLKCLSDCRMQNRFGSVYFGLVRVCYFMAFVCVFVLL